MVRLYCFSRQSIVQIETSYQRIHKYLELIRILRTCFEAKFQAAEIPRRATKLFLAISRNEKHAHRAYHSALRS